MQEQEFNKQLRTFWEKEAPDVSKITLFDGNFLLAVTWILAVADWTWFGFIVEQQITGASGALCVMGAALTVLSLVITAGSFIELKHNHSDYFYRNLKDTSISGEKIVAALRKAQAKKKQQQARNNAVIQSLSESLKDAENDTLEKRIEALNAENAWLLKQLNER